MSGGIHWELRETGRQRFNPGAREYEIDLGTANVSRFREQLAPLPGHAGKISRGQRSRPGRPPPACRASAGVRARAREHVIEVSGPGRIPAAAKAATSISTRQDRWHGHRA